MINDKKLLILIGKYFLIKIKNKSSELRKLLK
jgi:hypothetical protein